MPKPVGAFGVVRNTGDMKQTGIAQENDHRHSSKAVDAEDVRGMVEKHRRQRGGLIAILSEIQARYGWLPEAALRVVSEKLGRSLGDIYGVATFYRSFSLVPRGKHLVCACLGTACHVRGAQRVVEELEHRLGIRAGQTTSDRLFSLETVNCLGACALGPVVVTDGHYHSKIKKSAVADLLAQAAKGNGSSRGGKGLAFGLSVCCPRCQQKLADASYLMDDLPSILLNATCRGRQGWIRLSSLYGSEQLAAEFPVAQGSVVNFQCPHCHIPLPSPVNCWDCSAPVASLQLMGGGKLSLCSRRGCGHHLLDIA
jgi:NADH-quinone oxidoreductase subunit E